MITEHGSGKLVQMLLHLDSTAVLFEEFGCYVALSADKNTVFFCPSGTDGSPERDDNHIHMNWSQVTAPDFAFIQAVNDKFGTTFDWQKFSGR